MPFQSPGPPHARALPLLFPSGRRSLAGWAAVRWLHSFTLSDGWRNHLANGGGGASLPCALPNNLGARLGPRRRGANREIGGGLLWRQMMGTAPQRMDRPEQ
ncbi:hypothetical protein MTO96_024160 [Rhipicephalus appendiculatus]